VGAPHGWGASVSRPFCVFATYRNGMLCTGGVIVDCREAARDPSQAEFAALARAAHRPDAAAFGKIAVVRSNEIAVYEGARGTSPTFCGNATAAALRYLNGDGEARALVRCGDRSCDVAAYIHGRSVAHSWFLPETVIEQHDWRGRRTIKLTALNRYAIVIGSLPTRAEEARAELVGVTPDSKLAVVDPTHATPFAEFHNSNGRHGAAPHTGLATIALAALSLPWFAALFPEGRLQYRTRNGVVIDELPALSPMPDRRLVVPMPAMAVDFRESAAVAAA
jgi:hypothetical protein